MSGSNLWKYSFHMQTCYRDLDISVPECFLALEECYAKYVKSWKDACQKYYLVHAENICRRMSDVDLYATFLGQSMFDENPFRGANIARTFMVGYLSSCKSVLDAAAIAISEIVGLKLAYREQDFSKGKFWSEMKKHSEAIYQTYTKFQSVTTEIIRWRDAAIHRSSPIIMIVASAPPDTLPREDVEIKMVSDPSLGRGDFFKKEPIVWMDPLNLHEKWRPILLNLCGLLCNNIAKRIEQDSLC